MIFSFKFLLVFVSVVFVATGKSVHPNYAEDIKREGPPLFMKIYFFNVTNADDVIYNGAKPALQERGPYTFAERRQKVDMVFHFDDETLSYREVKTYKFQGDLSSGNLDDLITIPNVPVISIVSIVQTRSEADKTKLGFILKNNIPLYRTQTVKELIFDGYFDPFVDMAQKANGEETLPNATFGFLYGQNNTDDGEYVVNSGSKDVNKQMEIISWRGERELPYWPKNTTCAMINGTDGFRYGRFLTKESILRSFTPLLPRSIYAVYEQEIEFQEISAYRFTVPFELLADPTLAPENGCFCPEGDCLLSGLLNASTANDGAPIVLSMPHFYQAHPLLQLTVEGLKPDKDKHQTALDVEPTTGIVVSSANRIQINVQMKPSYPLFTRSNFAYMPSLVHPIVWISEEYQIGDISEEMSFRK